MQQRACGGLSQQGMQIFLRGCALSALTIVPVTILAGSTLGSGPVTFVDHNPALIYCLRWRCVCPPAEFAVSLLFLPLLKAVKLRVRTALFFALPAYL